MLVDILQKLFVIYILLFCAAVITGKLFGEKSSKTASRGVSDVTQIKGIATPTGGESSACLCLTTENGAEYKLVGDCLRKIEVSPQGQMISLKGKIQKEAPGAPAVFYATEIIED